ncbi:MAG TPA: AAA family ATPase [Gaiellaceae bacterium]
MVESPVLDIRLFGELELRMGDRSLPRLESARAESLLAYLLLHREAAQPRQRLAFLLWPDSTEPQARTNLRHVLHNLRHSLPDADRYLEVGQRTLRWRPDAPFRLDVAAFDEALARSALAEAVDAYGGDLLAGSYDEWLLEERDCLRDRYLGALERLVELHEAEDPARAIAYADRLLRADPLREQTYRLLMGLHDARGDRARALHVYHVCTATLERELGVEPSAATQELYEALLPAERDPGAERLRGPALVGRAQERAQLAELWRTVERGAARFVLVTGEPGIGKTRLVEELASLAEHRGAATAEARSYAAEGALAYGPVAAWLRSDALAARRERLDRGRLAVLSRLLPEIEGEPPEPLPESEERQRLYSALGSAILAPGPPLLLVADDLHWADQETLQFLHYLLRVQPEARLLVAATARREEVDESPALRSLATALRAAGTIEEIELDRLSRDATATLAGRVTGRELPDADVDRLFGETEGNPLFVLEAVRAGWTGGETLSPRVQAVLEARLAQLSEQAREVVGVAAAIGRQLTVELLAATSDVGEERLVRVLDELWRRRIVREQAGDAYDFSHDKLREVAYAALGPALRRRHHARIAAALERLHADDPGPVSAQIASHHDLAGAAREAVLWYERAAAGAQRMHASVEAIRLLDRALELVRTVPSGPDRDEQELALVVARLAPLGVVEGATSTRLVEAEQRGLELAESLGREPAPLLRWTALTNLTRGRFDEARRAGEQLLTHAGRDADDVLLVESSYVLGIAAFWSGELEAARRHFEQAVARYDREHRGVHLARYGLDPEVICLGRLGNTLFFLGSPGAAVRARDTALELAGEVGHASTTGTALVFAALLALELRDEESLRRFTAELAVQHGGAATDLALGSFEAYLDVLDGRSETGLGRLRELLAVTREAAHAPGQHACMVRLLLEAYARTADAAAGLGTAEHALQAVTGVRLWEAETRRMRAEFLADLSGPSDEVDAELERALELAGAQGSRTLQLRAAGSLLRRRLERGDERGSEEARGRLAAVLEALPEPTETPDRREAEAVLRST